MNRINTPSTDMFLASPSTAPVSVMMVTGQWTSVRGDFRFSIKPLDTPYLVGYFGLGNPSVKFSEPRASLRVKFLADFWPWSRKNVLPDGKIA